MQPENLDHMSIPNVDLAKFTKGTADERKEFVYELGRAYEDVGFVAVKNHGIPDDLIDELYKYVKAFFELPSETKKQYEKPELAGQRGYTSFGKEHAKGSEAPDLKEFYQYGQTVENEDPVAAEYPANIVKCPANPSIIT